MHSDSKLIQGKEECPEEDLDKHDWVKVRASWLNILFVKLLGDLLSNFRADAFYFK